MNDTKDDLEKLEQDLSVKFEEIKGQLEAVRKTRSLLGLSGLAGPNSELPPKLNGSSAVNLEFKIEVKKRTTLIKTVERTVLIGLTHFAKAAEISDALLPYYQGKSPDKFRVQVTVLLSKLYKDNIIQKHQYSSSLKDSIWGSIDWFDTNDKPLNSRLRDEHKSDKE